MVHYVPQRPIRGGALSHSATAAIHHANLEREQRAQACVVITLLSKTVKTLLLTALDT